VRPAQADARDRESGNRLFLHCKLTVAPYSAVANSKAAKY
jgi:hypothetical protein